MDKLQIKQRESHIMWQQKMKKIMKEPVKCKLESKEEIDEYFDQQLQIQSNIIGKQYTTHLKTFQDQIENMPSRFNSVKVQKNASMMSINMMKDLGYRYSYQNRCRKTERNMRSLVGSNPVCHCIQALVLKIIDDQSMFKVDPQINLSKQDLLDNKIDINNFQSLKTTSEKQEFIIHRFKNNLNQQMHQFDMNQKIKRIQYNQKDRKMQKSQKEESEEHRDLLKWLKIDSGYGQLKSRLKKEIVQKINEEDREVFIQMINKKEAQKQSKIQSKMHRSSYVQQNQIQKGQEQGDEEMTYRDINDDNMQQQMTTQSQTHNTQYSENNGSQKQMQRKHSGLYVTYDKYYSTESILKEYLSEQTSHENSLYQLKNIVPVTTKTILHDEKSFLFYNSKQKKKDQLELEKAVKSKEECQTDEDQDSNYQDDIKQKENKEKFRPVLQSQWDEQKEKMYKEYIDQSQQIFYNQDKLTNWRDLGIMPILQAILRKDNVNSQIKQLVKRFSAGEWLQKEELTAIIRQSPLINQCLDKQFIQQAYDLIDKKDIYRLELSIAEGIIVDHNYMKEILQKKRFNLLENKNNQKIREIRNYNRQKQEEERQMLEQKTLQKQEKTFRTLSNHIDKYVRDKKGQDLKSSGVQQDQYMMADHQKIHNIDTVRQLRHLQHPPSKIFRDDVKKNLAKYSEDYVGGADQKLKLQQELQIQKQEECNYLLHYGTPKQLKVPTRFKQYYSGGPLNEQEEDYQEIEIPDTKTTFKQQKKLENKLSQEYDLVGFRKLHMQYKTSSEYLKNLQATVSQGFQGQTEKEENKIAEQIMKKQIRSSYQIFNKEELNELDMFQQQKLMQCARLNDVQYLVNAGFNLNKKQKQQELYKFSQYRYQTALHFACKNGNERLVYLIMECFYPRNNVNEQYTDELMTPQHYAFRSNNEFLIHMLVNHYGANLNVMNIKQQTPLYFANYQTLINLGIQSGAKTEKEFKSSADERVDNNHLYDQFREQNPDIIQQPISYLYRQYINQQSIQDI